MRASLTFSLLLAIASAQAQTVRIKNVELAGEKVIVHYDLEDSNTTNEYMLQLYASQDNFATPLKKVKGDIGLEVKPGLNKKIEWSAAEEWNGFKGRFTLEVRGKVYVPFVKLQTIETGRAFKRGKQYDVGWKAGNTNPIHIELFKGAQRIRGDMSQPNSGSYTLNLPPDLKPGKDYRLKITDSKSSDESIYSNFFKVTPKVPMFAKIAGGLILVGGGVFAATSGGGGGKESPTVSTEIELPDLPN